MRRELTAPERLIVAADFEPDDSGVSGVLAKVIALADELNGLGVYIKVESILRAAGYDLIHELHSRELKVFADLKLSGIPQTLAHDAKLLAPYKPELVTAMAQTGRDSMRELKMHLPDSEVLAVTFLTTMNGDDAARLFGCDTEENAVHKFAIEAEAAGFDGLISAPGELDMLFRTFANRFSYNTPNVRPDAIEVVGDDQNRKRSMTPGNAIRHHAKRLVIGRPITQAKNRRDAAERMIEEIHKTMHEITAP